MINLIVRISLNMSMALIRNTHEIHEVKICIFIPWWRHQMETFSASLALCEGNSPVPVNSPHKGQWRGALMFSLICVWINGWVNNREAGNLRRYRSRYDVIVMRDSLTSYPLNLTDHKSVSLKKIPHNSTKMGSTWGRKDPCGPHVVPMKLAIWDICNHYPL